MRGYLYAMQPAAYEKWLTQGQPASSMAQSGEKLYRQDGCSGCHENSTIVHAPPLKGLYGKPVPLQSGDIVLADDAYIRDSILLPAKDIAGGYTNDMPSFQGHISEDELFQLLAYIKSLSDTTPEKEATEEGQ